MWDERYQTDDYVYGREPNDYLRDHAHYLKPGGRVLCLSEGEGRNAVWLAQQGFAVTAVDASAVGRRKALALADAHGVAIDYHHADLADFDLGDHCWDGIVSIFAHLPPALRHRVHAQVAVALKPGGVFLLEAYTPQQLAYKTGGPGDPDWLLNPERLVRELPSLQFDYLAELERTVVEGICHTGLAHVVQAVGRTAPPTITNEE